MAGLRLAWLPVGSADGPGGMVAARKDMELEFGEVQLVCNASGRGPDTVGRSKDVLMGQPDWVDLLQRFFSADLQHLQNICSGNDALYVLIV